MTVAINVISFPKHKTIGKENPKERNDIYEQSLLQYILFKTKTHKIFDSNEEKNCMLVPFRWPMKWGLASQFSEECTLYSTLHR
jgi:hypothetical protein